MPMPPRPGGVEMATMVSCESSTDLLKCNLGGFFWRGERVFLQGVLGKSGVLEDGFLMVKLW